MPLNTMGDDTGLSLTGAQRGAWMEQFDVLCSIMQYRERRRKRAARSPGRGRDVRFGIFILGDKPPQLTHEEVLANVLEEARWAEELGFDEVWLAEHHFS